MMQQASPRQAPVHYRTADEAKEAAAARVPSLAALCGDTERVERLQRAARVLCEGSERPCCVVAVRLMLAEAGLSPAAGNSAREFTTGLLRLGWRVIPAGLAPVQAGWLAVRSDAARIPQRIAVAAKVSTDHAWFYAVDEGPRERWEVRDCDFWLAPPGG